METEYTSYTTYLLLDTPTMTKRLYRTEQVPMTMTFLDNPDEPMMEVMKNWKLALMMSMNVRTKLHCHHHHQPMTLECLLPRPHHLLPRFHHSLLHLHPHLCLWPQVHHILKPPLLWVQSQSYQ